MAMKRPREELHNGHQVQVPLISSHCNGSAQLEVLGKGKAPTDNDSLAYMKSVKVLFGDKPEKYNEFLQALRGLNERRIDMAGIKSRVRGIFEGNNNFIFGFNIFLPKGCEIDPYVKPSYIEPHYYEEARNLMDALKTQSVYKSVLDAFNMYRNHSKSINKLFKKLGIALDKHKSFMECLVEKYHPDNATTSSILHEASGRTKYDAEVLNDKCESGDSKSNNHSFKPVHKNQNEVKQFAWEDEMFELEVLIGSVDSTIEHVEKQLVRINDSAKKPCKPACIEDFYSRKNLRCIEHIYGEHGLDMIDQLHKNETRSLPIILQRLKQKRGEWFLFRSEMKEKLAKVYVNG